MCFVYISITLSFQLLQFLPPSYQILNERLRAYERSKLRWYYAIAEFDSARTASAVYEGCDGIEFARSSNVMDLRRVMLLIIYLL